MMPSRAELKTEAKLVVKRKNPSILNVSLVYIIFGILVSMLSNRVLYGGVSASDLARYLELVESGNLDYAMRLAGQMMPGSLALGISQLLAIMLTIVDAGYIIFLLNAVRGNGPCFGNLLDGFGFFIKILLLTLFESIFIALWSLLLVVPGIIASYRYRMAIYILVDDPSKSPMQCIRESKQAMKGHKMELFVLDLSFIGWTLLEGLPVLGYAIRLWVVPYMMMTYVLYYEHLCGRRSVAADAGPVYTDWQ